MKNLCLPVILLSVSGIGCYTQLMSPKEFLQTQRAQRSQRTVATAEYSSSMNYQQSCVTCHSSMELDERSEEMEYYGIRTVHDGTLLSSRDWQDAMETPVAFPPIYLPAPNPYWPNPYQPGNSWWAPATGTAAVDNPAGNRPRPDGPTRDPDGDRERPQPGGTPVYTQPSTPVGGTPVTTTPQTSTAVSAPAPETAAPPENVRSRDENKASGTSAPQRPRTDGATRDENNNRPR